MEDDLENTENEAEEGPKPKKRMKLTIPWKLLALYILPAVVVFIIFIVMHNSLVQPPLSREEIVALINDTNKEEHSEDDPEKESDLAKNTSKEIQQGSDIPFIGPQHYYQSFTGALATDLKNDSGILTIELAVSIFMGKLNADAYFESFKTFEPALRSAILALMRTKTKEQVDTNQGKEALKLEILETINNELIKLGAKPEIKTVQLTKLLLI
ncbi:flagellar basal body-associated FliL family protein [Paracoccaceae bacterium]|nr:flagellar basal body-associated FliL family protein [Paracoccaceae bacterium]